jgi:hypothetical protein
VQRQVRRALAGDDQAYGAGPIREMQATGNLIRDNCAHAVAEEAKWQIEEAFQG